MSDDGVIVLSDDCSDGGDESPSKNKSKHLDDRDSSILRKKSESDFSDNEFPVVRFSEINYKPTTKKDFKSGEPNALHLSDFNCSNHNDSKEARSTDSPGLYGENEKKSAEELLDDSFDKMIQAMGMNNLLDKEKSNFRLPEVNLESNNDRAKNDAEKFDSDSDYESQHQPRKNLRVNEVNVELSSDEQEKSNENEKVVEKKVRRKRKKATDQVDDDEKEKAPKPTKKRGPKAASKTNPKDCMKLMEVILDEKIKNYDFFNDFSKAAEENEIKYRAKSQLVPKSVTWKRTVEELDDEQDSGLTLQTIDENQMLIIWDCEETVKHIHENTFVSTISSIKSLMPRKKLTLVMYKMLSYFKYIKSARGQAAENDKQKKNKAKSSKGFSSYPRISRKQFDECLVEIQLLYNTSSRSIETSNEIVMLIQQYTKSLAALPSKMEKDEKLSEIDWCISVDNRDSVKIDKEGNGLIRLWQQQLCQFAQTSLETSEAIATAYKSPLQLMEAYANCTQIEGETLLKDIPIRRNAGVLTSSKKIGPELSKKLYVMFTSTDGDAYLN